MYVKIIKFDNYKEPNRAHYNDSGADVFSAEDIEILPHSVRSVKTGIGVVLPDGYDAVVHCKSGMSSKGIFSSNAPIDSGYRGEIHAILYNSTDSSFFVKRGMKIGQLVVRPVIYVNFVEELGKDRNEDSFGSTGDR